MIIVKDSIQSCLIDSPCDLEFITISVGSPGVVLSTVYIPPYGSDHYHCSLITYLSSLSSRSNDLVIVGDFNFPDICWSSLSGSNVNSNKFCDFVFENNCLNSSLAQLIFEATR